MRSGFPESVSWGRNCRSVGVEIVGQENGPTGWKFSRNKQSLECLLTPVTQPQLPDTHPSFSYSSYRRPS